MADKGLLLSRGLARQLSGRTLCAAAGRSSSASEGLRLFGRGGSASQGLRLTAATPTSALPQAQVSGAGPGAHRALSGLAGDSPASIVGLHIGAAAGVTPFPVPSPMLEPFASTGRGTMAAPTPAAGTDDGATAGAMPLAPSAAGAAGGKVEELVDAPLDAAPSSRVYGKPSHPYRASVHVPPKYARREFADLFGGVDKSVTSGMSMITLALKTRSDMATWSSEIVEEREVLMKEFHTLAARVVDNLRAAGYWADYVDPASGKAHYAATSSGRFLETDDRLALYGYRILDYGCCKAVSHPEWGTHVMVGAVFTDAPHEIVKRLAAVVSADSPPMSAVAPAPTVTAAGSTCDAASVAAVTKGAVPTPSK